MLATGLSSKHDRKSFLDVASLICSRLGIARIMRTHIGIWILGLAFTLHSLLGIDCLFGGFGLMGFSGLAAVGASEPVRMVSDPTISPDGSMIAFTWRDDVWTASIDGGAIKQVTTDPARDSQPHFSPDGARIAYVSNRTGANQIYVVATEGGVPTQVTDHSDGYQIHDWFPGGKSLLASGNRDHHWRGAERLMKVSVDKRSADVVLADATATDASLDRKGNRILFVREGERWWRKGYRGERASQVWMLDLKSGEMEELLHEGVDSCWPAKP